MPADTVLSISPQPREPLSKTIGTVEEIITSTSLPAARSRRPSSPIGGRRRLTKSRFNTQSKLSRRNTLAIERVLDVDSRSLTSVSYETASAPRPQHATLPLRRDLRMGRAYTSPDSFAWQLSDRVDDDDDDISNTVVLSPRSAFDARLPREVKLHVFAVVIQLHEIEYRKRMVSSGWTAVQSASERYVGRSRGFVDLIRLSRVSKSWRSLAFDGQLWSQLDLQMLAQMPVPAVTRIFAAAGPFIRDMNFQGYQSLSVQLLKRFASAIVIAQPGRKCLPTSQLTSLNLAGCNLVATKMLHELILASPNLRWVSFKGLACVTNVTCVILGRTCSQLCSLNLSRCKNMDATGVVSVASVPLGSKVPYTSLEELRLCGLKGASAALVVALARGSPFLKTLDLSYSTGLTDGDLDVFTAWRSEWNDLTDSSSPFDKISLSAREMGYDPSDPTRYFKRLTRLRHLNISNCKLLTDAACSHLAYAVPRLESLEIAGLGQGLEDDGLARLLRTTPLLKRLDLEDSIEISNAILEVLTPEQDPHRSRRARPLVVDPRPGDHLEHLILSCCSRITSDALVSLIKACPRLRVLEIDGTRAGASVVREFVRYSKRRNLVGAEVNVSDCRGLPGDSLVRELNPHTRHRRGWRGWDARRLRFLDSEGDCDESRVLFKSFWTWQAADAARAARDRRLKSAVATGTATTLEGMEMQQLLESEELSFRDPTDARQARFRWVKALGQLSPSSESCTIM
ncbi:RNI-like protein [Auriculariales sp. MPI-PUGE-AT-0066]|nr:RNI-like protein [Auriculariales sp. MPI-PUGE-AT-0066]